MKRVRLQTGDIILIPLSNSQAALGQLVMLDLRPDAPLNPLLRVVKGVYDLKDFDLDKIDLTDELFPPIITGVGGAVKTGYWYNVGNKPVDEFIFPKFVSTNYNQDTGEARGWWLNDGTGSYQIGKVLPDEYKKLEYRVVLSPADVAERIITGEVSWPYGDLIRYNKFTPKKDSNSNDMQD